jgi:hypothetical protein
MPKGAVDRLLYLPPPLTVYTASLNIDGNIGN